MRIFKWLKRKSKNNSGEFTLKRCVERGLLTEEEKLRIEKDRAIGIWKNEVLNLRKKAKK